MYHLGPTLDVNWRNNVSFATSSTDNMIYVCKIGENCPIKTFAGHQVCSWILLLILLLSIASIFFYSWPTLGLSVDFCWELPAPPLGMFQFTQKLYIEPKINQVAKHVFTSLAPTLVVVVTRIASLCLNLFFLTIK